MNENKNFYKVVFALVVPIALQNLINVGVTSADVIMLGKVSEVVLSASSLAGQVNFILTLIFFGLTSGAAVLSAQYWGKGDTKTIEKILGISLRFSISIGIFFTIITFIFSTQIMHIFSSEETVITEGSKFLRIICFSYLFTSVTMIYLNIMRSVERVIIATIVYLVSLCVNIGINALLIFGLGVFPKLGIEGAAIGTTCARAVELIIVMIYDRKFNHIIRFRLKTLFSRDKELFRDFLSFSLPVIINELLWGAGTSTNAAILGKLGSHVAAASSIAQVTRQLATVVTFGISTAAAIMIGKAIGENKLDLAKKYGGKFVRLSIFLGCAGAVVVLIMRPIAMANMNLTDQAAGYLSAMMYVMSYFVIAQAFNTTMIVGIFRAGGDTRIGLIIDVATMWCCSILIGWLAAFIFKWSIPIVYVILLSDEIAKLPLTTWRYFTYKWLKNVTR